MTDSPIAAPSALRVHHLAVKVVDLDRAENFYGGVLGLPVRARHTDAEGAPRSIWFSLGDEAFLAVERAAHAVPTRTDTAPGWHCVALRIEPASRDAWRARLEAAGHAVEHETSFTLYTRDPEGALVGLSHHPVAAHVDPTTSSAHAAGSSPPRASSARRATSRVAAALGAASLVLALAAPGADAQRSRVPTAPPDAIIVGSSSVNGALGRMIEAQLVESGLRVQRMGHSSTGFARPDFFDWQAEIPRLGELGSLRGAVVYMGGNDTQAIRLRDDEREPGSRDEWIQWRDEARWTARYTARVRAFVDGLCAAGLRRAVVVLPSDGEREGWAERIHRVQNAQVEGVRDTACGVVVDPRGGRVREGDTVDGVHLTRQGARTLLLRIGPPIVAAIAG